MKPSPGRIQLVIATAEADCIFPSGRGCSHSAGAIYEWQSWLQLKSRVNDFKRRLIKTAANLGPPIDWRSGPIIGRFGRTRGEAPLTRYFGVDGFEHSDCRKRGHASPVVRARRGPARKPAWAGILARNSRQENAGAAKQSKESNLPP